MIVWRYLKHVPSSVLSDEKPVMWLSLKCRNYITKRFFDYTKNRTDSSRYTYSKYGIYRNGIMRLYWGAKSVNGEEKYIKLLFQNQDLYVAVLERKWSHNKILVKWFFDFMIQPVSELLINIKNGDSNNNNNNILQEYLSKSENSTILSATNSLQKRQIIKIFYGMMSQKIYDAWDEKIFMEEMKRATIYSLNLYYSCKKEYDKMLEKHNINKKHDKWENIIVKLINKPPNLEKWVKENFDIES